MRNRRAASVAAGFVTLLALNTAVANADPDVVGKQYGEAKGLLYQANLRPVVSTIVGDRVAQDQCFVVSTSKVTARDSSGVATTNQVQVNLNCYARPADRTTPGFSKANLSPDAVAVRETGIEATKKWKQSEEGQEWCAETAAEHPEWGPLPDCSPAADAVE